MTEDPSELSLCPNCGKGNLPMATRCVHCGSEMESLFTISGQPQSTEDQSEDSLPDIMEEIRNDPALQTPAEIEPNPETLPADQVAEPTFSPDHLPDWLAKVRERAQGEEGAIGDLASGMIAMDAARSEEASAGVEGEFNAWINRIREKSQQENSVRVRQLPNETEDSDLVPEWLQRIRVLRPRSEEEITHEVRTDPTFADEMPREWTDEALQELRRQALAEDSEQETEPVPEVAFSTEEEKVPQAPASDDPGEIVPEEHELTEDDFHNIPDDEDEYPGPIPAEGLSPTPEDEDGIFIEEGAEEKQKAEEIEAREEAPEPQLEGIVEEPGQDVPLPHDSPAEESLVEEPASESEVREAPDEREPEPPLPEDQDEQTEAIERPTNSGAVPPDLLLLRDQQDRASLLASLIEQEGRVTAGKQPTRKPSGREGRLAVALLLLIGLIVSIVIGPAAIPADVPRSIPAMALSDQIHTLAENDQVLVVLDYQAATSREIESLASPLLAQLQSQGSQIAILTSQPSGLFLAQSLLAQAGLPEETQVEYLPGSYLSLIGRAMNPAALDGQDNLTLVEDLRSFKLILLVSDSSDSIRGWLEQIAPWIAPVKFAAVTTQMEVPVLSPYFDSGQLVGYAAGIADGSIGTQATFSYRAYRLGLLLMLVMLLLGMISKGETDAIRREEERAE